MRILLVTLKANSFKSSRVQSLEFSWHHVKKYLKKSKSKKKVKLGEKKQETKINKEKKAIE